MSAGASKRRINTVRELQAVLNLLDMMTGELHAIRYFGDGSGSLVIASDQSTVTSWDHPDDMTRKMFEYITGVQRSMNNRKKLRRSAA